MDKIDEPAKADVVGIRNTPMRKIVIETDGNMINVSTNECSRLETMAIFNMLLESVVKG